MTAMETAEKPCQLKSLGMIRPLLGPRDTLHHEGLCSSKRGLRGRTKILQYAFHTIRISIGLLLFGSFNQKSTQKFSHKLCLPSKLINKMEESESD